VIVAALAWLLVVVGVVGAAWGVWAAFQQPRPWVGTVVAPLGILLALVGALLLFVPGFFG